MPSEYNCERAGNAFGREGPVHDRALIRAMKAEYKPNCRVIGHPERTVFVARLSMDTTEQQLRATFQQFGRIKRLRLVKDLVTGLSMRYAFVEYHRTCEARTAYSKADGIVLNGRRVVVDYELQRSLTGWKPRRLGGGFGGRTASGQLRFGCRHLPFRRNYRSDKKYEKS